MRVKILIRKLQKLRKGQRDRKEKKDAFSIFLAFPLHGTTKGNIPREKKQRNP